MKTLEPSWIAEARRHIGVTEIPGIDNSPVIKKWLVSLKAWWQDDETPWCGVFVAHCMQTAGAELPKNWMRAKAWADWGVGIPNPIPGCVVVFVREGGGHVGFVVGVDAIGNLQVLGGNQGNAVNLKSFKRDRVVAYRWPSSDLTGFELDLPVISSSDISRNEA